MGNELNQLSLYEVTELVRQGKASATELAIACVSRIERRESVVQAFASFDTEKILDNAKQLDQSNKKPKLCGAPIGIKDVIDTVDHVSSWGSSIYESRKPLTDASCVALCRAAGANVFGKTVTTEFAYFYPGKTVNPHNPEHTPGGSSMGSAAAVADYMLPFAFGTQTAASVTRPAAYCGVIGYKPSYSSFDLQGVCGLASSLDTLGFICRDLRDIPLMRNVLCADQEHINPRGEGNPPRIGVVHTPHWDIAEESTKLLLTQSASSLEKSGAAVEEIDLPKEFDHLADRHNDVMAFEVARSRSFEYNNHREKLSQQFIDLVETGNRISYQQYLTAKQDAQNANAKLDNLFEQYDVLLAPSASGEAPRGLDATGNPIFSRMWTLLHVPSITIPVTKGPAGLPLGIQFVGRFNRDNQLISNTAWAKQALA